MRIRLVLAAVCIFSLPLWSTPSLGVIPINSAAFSTVAFAGHVTPSGRYCDCGTADCECDPGELARSSGNAANQQNAAPTDITSELGIILLAVVLFLRLQAA